MMSSVGVERPDFSLEKIERMASESEEPASLESCFCRSLSSSSEISFEDIMSADEREGLVAGACENAGECAFAKSMRSEGSRCM